MMNNLKQYIIEKLHLTKDIDINNFDPIFNEIKSIIKHTLNELGIKSKQYELNIFNIKEQSLYNPSDWGAKHYIHVEFTTKKYNSNELRKYSNIINLELHKVGFDVHVRFSKFSGGNCFMDVLIQKLA